ncbi:hydrolase, putative [Ricinus communis]|uniref:Hydrolase, putative n=1 Tax=Ricinus communis TaxID=3988 RepID=B9RXJ5_RICCO|nr:hydrolase, putative [Ricinus communis]
MSALILCKAIACSSLRQKMSWTCKKCTFINSPSPKSTCQICLSPPSPLPSSSSPPPHQETPKWSCKACTFLNVYKNTSCEICGTRASLSSLSSFGDLNDIGLDGDLDSSVGSVFLPLRICKRKITDSTDVVDKDSVQSDSSRGVKASNKAVYNVEEEINPPIASSSFKILSYNVWFREALEVHKRMKALGDIIQLHSPDVICFQVFLCPQIPFHKHSIISIIDFPLTYCHFAFQELSKLQVRSFSCRPFNNSVMGRELCIAELEVPHSKPLVVATSHLESPCPAPPTWDQMFSKERVDQAKEATNALSKNPNVIFGGDMNWDDKLDGQFPLPGGWVDAWAELRPGENGWTYDTKCNKMLSGNRTLQKRLDRFVCSLRDFKISKIDTIGKEAIPGLSHIKEKKVRKEVKMLELPVLPSDHYGLLLTISAR